MSRQRSKTLRGLSALIGAATLCAAAAAQTSVPVSMWPDRGVWLKGDFHTHTTFSDGSHTVEEVVAAAARNGCDIVAITDHSDGNLRAGTPEYVDAIRNARAAHPDMTIVAGMEWNVPPGKGQEHATILFPTAFATSEVMSDFKERFDDQTKTGENGELAAQALTTLMKDEHAAVAPVVFFNHPSRRPDSTSAPRLTFATLQRTMPSPVIGFEGAPGHQRGTPLGAYPASVSLVDRWDPLAAEPDGVWDQWLRQGLNVWAAVANSDFHNERDDYWPCEFAATRVWASDRTVDGVIRAMRTGSFFAEHGHIADEVDLRVRTDNQRTLHAGETGTTAAGHTVTVSLELHVPSTDFRGRSNHIDIVELLGVSATRTAVLFSGSPAGTRAFTVSAIVPPGGIVFRARGRRVQEQGPALMFYTNPIRITALGR